MTQYSDLFYESHDGLTLYARDYAGVESAPALICIPGLTRNSADFEELCDTLAGEYRLLAVDLRGRGRSDADPNPLNYHPGNYAQDIASLLQAASLKSAIFIGTSLGGLVAMTLAATSPDAVRGIVLNDVGPEINPAGLARIRSYVSNARDVTSWEEAVEATREIQQDVLPGLSDSEWQVFTRRLYRERADGTPVLNFDAGISVLVEAQDPTAEPADLWSLFAMLADLPMLVIRGEHSDILSTQIVSKMAAMHRRMSYLEVKERGHAPLLNEPEVVPAIKQFLKQFAAV